MRAMVFFSALAAAALLVPAVAFAQMHRESRGRSGPGIQGGVRDRGGVRGDLHGRGGFRDRDDFRGHRSFRSDFGIWFGPALDPWWWGPWGYPAPYYDSYPYQSPSYRYYEPPPVTLEPQPYDEQAQGARQEEATSYYCADPPGYYPYVRQCPKGWAKVVPNPQSATPPPPPPPAPAEAQAPDPGRGGPVPESYQWYHCQNPEGYYPYIRDCPTGWTMVAPRPALER